MLVSLFTSSWEKEKTAAVSPVTAATEDGEGGDLGTKPERTHGILSLMLIN